jgi:hypothetical protein
MFENLRNRWRKSFATLQMSNNIVEPTDKIAATKLLPSNLVSYIVKLTDFPNLDEDEIYEQLSVWEPEIGGSLDRLATMVGDSYKGFAIKNPDDKTNDKLQKDMVDDANEIAETIDIVSNHETFTDILYTHGNLYLELKDDLSMSVLPNKYVTLVDSLDRLQNMVAIENINLITEANYLILYEGMQSQRILKKGTFIHVKYKSSPTFVTDSKGRRTFGVYCPSPLHRVVISVWWKRLTMITDILFRARVVPREHHAISAEMFNLNNYAGDLATKRASASAEISSFLENYVETIQNQMPDQGYATLDTVEIKMIENKSGGYMQTNELIDQINSEIMMAINLPKSITSGESKGSYASELVISNYVGQKVLQLSKRIKPVILNNMRERLKLLNPEYPIDKLDIKYDFNIATTELEVFRQLAVMATLGVFTETEIREHAGFEPLREEQRKEIVNIKASAGTGMDNTQGSGSNAPQTPQSDIQHSNDASTRETRTDK